MAYCRNCGLDLPGNPRVCPQCGQDQDAPVGVQEERSSTSDTATTTPQQAGRAAGTESSLSRYGRYGCVGCSGLIIVIVVLVALVGATLGPPNQATSPSPSASSEEETEEEKSAKQQKEEENATGSVGEIVAVGDAAWSVINAQKTEQLNHTFGVLPPKQGNFVVVDFLYGNYGNEAKTLHHNALQLVDSSGRKSDPDTDTFGYIPQEKSIFLQQVNPGVAKEGQVIFSVAPNGSGYKLLLKDTNLLWSERNQAEVDLGF